jgi:prepilin peptidase CpaA
MFTAQNFSLFAVLLFTLITAWTDVRERRIPNLLTFPFFFAGIVYQIVLCTMYDGSILQPVLGLAVAIGILGSMWAFGGTGAGDVKLMMGLGVWLGLDKVLVVMLLSLVTSLSLLVIIKTLLYFGIQTGIDLTKLKKGEEPKRVIVKGGVRYKRGIPYALGVCLASWMFIGLNLVRQIVITPGQ